MDHTEALFNLLLMRQPNTLREFFWLGVQFDEGGNTFLDKADVVASPFHSNGLADPSVEARNTKEWQKAEKGHEDY
jgi:hypothetical protein